jgi:dinuclear metal center YbgI/SA1388 family protein
MVDRGHGRNGRVGRTVAADSYRGAEIRTRDLTDPNGARYQAAPRPEGRGLSQAGVAARAVGVERHHAADPGVLRIDLDVVEQTVELEDLHGLVEPVLDAGAEAGGPGERRPPHARAGRWHMTAQPLLEMHPLHHAVRVAHRAAERNRVGWQDHPDGGYGCPMADRDAIVAHLDKLLDPGAHPDHLPVGLQVEGAADVTRVATGVSASLELFRRAGEAGAQMLIVHHGLFWDGESRRIGARERDRLRALFDHDLSLCAYHLALDAHPRVGNNALICAELGLLLGEAFGVGFMCEADPPLAIDDLLARVRDRIAPAPLVFRDGPAVVGRVAVVSGAAARDTAAAADAGADCLLTGEPREAVMMDAREAGIHVIAAGHYATEVFGVRALGEEIAARFGVEHVFIDLPNPV